MKKFTLITALIAFASFAFAQTVPRTPLHEVFTSSTCIPCKPGNENLDAILDANPGEWACIKYQMYWPTPGDPYYTTEGNSRRGYYNVNTVPNLWVDGGWGSNPVNYTQVMFDYYKSTATYLDIVATYTVDEIGQQVDVDVSIDVNTNYNSNALRLHIGIVENTTYNNVKNNGQTSFRYVMKKMVPNSGGTVLSPLTPGPPVQFSDGWTFQGSYRLPNNANDPINHSIEHSVEEFSDLAVVVWVQDNADKQVHNSAWATIPVGISALDNSGSGIVGLYPNPAVSFSELHYNVHGSHNLNITVYNMLGEVIFSENKGELPHGNYFTGFNVEEWPSGVYIVKLAVDDEVYTKKMNVYK